MSDDAPAAEHEPLGPSELRDPVVRKELKKAGVWFGLGLAIAAIIFLAQPLLLIFGGIVFASMLARRGHPAGSRARFKHEARRPVGRYPFSAAALRIRLRDRFRHRSRKYSLSISRRPRLAAGPGDFFGSSTGGRKKPGPRAGRGFGSLVY